MSFQISLKHQLDLIQPILSIILKIRISLPTKLYLFHNQYIFHFYLILIVNLIIYISLIHSLIISFLKQFIPSTMLIIVIFINFHLSILILIHSSLLQHYSISHSEQLFLSPKQTIIYYIIILILLEISLFSHIQSQSIIYLLRLFPIKKVIPIHIQIFAFLISHQI